MELKNEYEVRFNAIVRRGRTRTFSQKDAAWWVGGLERLKSLIKSGEIGFGKGSKPTAWKLNASDVLRHCCLK